jgi:hypothetical protein
MNKCQYCSKETDLPWMYLAMTLPIKEMEEKINKLGRDDWFKNVDWDNPTKEEDQLSFYDQLLSTIGRGYACTKCIKEEEELYVKYYGKE